MCLHAAPGPRGKTHFFLRLRLEEVIGGCSVFIPVFLAARGAAARRGWRGEEGPPTPPPLRTTCCSPVRCVRRDLLWPPLLPGFSSLGPDPLLLLSSTHTSIVRGTGRRLTHTRAHTHTHTRARTHTHIEADAHTLSIDRGSFKKA